MKFSVPEMSCGHCASSIEKAIKGVDGSARVECDLAGHVVSVQSNLSAEKIAEVMRVAGYDSQQLAT